MFSRMVAWLSLVLVYRRQAEFLASPTNIQQEQRSFTFVEVRPSGPPILPMFLFPTLHFPETSRQWFAKHTRLGNQSHVIILVHVVQLGWACDPSQRPFVSLKGLQEGP